MQEQEAPRDLLALYEATFGESPKLSQALDPLPTWRKIICQTYRELLGRVLFLAVAYRDHMSPRDFDAWIAGELLRVALAYQEDLATSGDPVWATWRYRLYILALAPPEGLDNSGTAPRPALLASSVVGEQRQNAREDLLEDLGLAGELLLLVGPPVPDGVRLRTARRLARQMALALADPNAGEALRQLAAQRKVAPHELLRDLLLPAGLLLAAADTEQPRPIRLGRGWVSRKATEISPLQLSLLDYAAWLRQEAHRYAVEGLVGPRIPSLHHDALGLDDCPGCGAALGRNQVCPRCGLAIPKSPFGVPRGRPLPVAPQPGSVLDAFIAADTLQEILDALSPQERDVLLLAAREGTPADEAATALASSPGAARVSLSRLRKKAARLLPPRKKAGPS